MKTIKKRNISNTSESGYTILEGIIAMIVVAVLMSAVAPVIAFAVGTRVQARRLELATQAANSYINWVKNDPTNNTPAILTNDSANVSVDALSCDDSGEYCAMTPGIGGQFYCVDGDDVAGCQDSSLTDMIVHGGSTTTAGNSSTYATNFADDASRGSVGYRMIVRVYRANAFKDAAQLTFELPSTYVNNAGLATSYVDGGERIERPLFQTQTDISPVTDKYQNLCERLGGCS
ncbi:hormogonium polysaccharide secretion pseudopilin HpsB [Okeania sp. SIO2B3]|uniref:hormogonium polysaccharide secretion pseudopilin HpsB n=1 Tax=Okeania sp. SIO2B3 TaxID=2607784 RepID=UPI0013C1FC1D|nr:hormogonium polysaccharide secretion pseudopilin HpsB [Okeania sp. SIO2B3]NET46484.1 type II secretion system protein [Okeania sp. SIO2B3]